MPSGPRVQYVTKLEAARRQLVTAIRLFFDDREPVSVYTLAHASWEIARSLCAHERKKTVAELIGSKTGISARELRDSISVYKNFFKHADRDPTAVLDDFGDAANDFVLFAATSDLMFLCKHRLPLEAWVFFSWHHALHPDDDGGKAPPVGSAHHAFAKISDKWFRDLPLKSRTEQKRCGKKVMLSWLSDPRKLEPRIVDRSQLRFWTD